MKQNVSRIKKNGNKKPNIMLIIFSAIIILILILVYLLFFKSNSNNLERCSTDYELNDKAVSKVEKKIKEIDQVESVDIHLNVCIVKIIIKLKEDVETEKLKSKITESLKEFDEEVLENYDLELFVTSNNKESKTYPMIVSKHKSQKDFYWE